MKVTIFTILIVLFTALISQDNNGWVLKKDTERFQLYVRDVFDSPIREINFISYITGTVPEALNIISEVEKFPKIFKPYVKKIKILKKNNFCSEVYMLLAAPLIEDRKTIVKLCINHDPSLNFFTVKWNNISSTHEIMNQDSAVDIPITRGSCVFTKAKADYDVQVSCEASLNLGGSLPVFIMNEINTKAVPQVVWKIYDEIIKRRKL